MSDQLTLGISGLVDSFAALNAKDTGSAFLGSGVANLGLTAEYKPGDNFSAKADVQLMGGFDNQDAASRDTAQTILGGRLDRYVVYRGRSQFGNPNFLIANASLDLNFFKNYSIFGGIIPQENRVYPYGHNNDGVPTLRYNLFDNTSAGNIYTSQIGLAGGFKADNLFVDGLTLSALVAADGGINPNGALAKTIQVAYANADAGLDAALFATHMDSTTPVTEDGEETSGKFGVGGRVKKIIGPVTAEVGYAFNQFNITGNRTTTTNTVHAVNASAQMKPTDSLSLAAGLSILHMGESSMSDELGLVSNPANTEVGLEVYGGYDFYHSDSLNVRGFLSGSFVLGDPSQNPNVAYRGLGNEYAVGTGLTITFGGSTVSEETPAPAPETPPPAPQPVPGVPPATPAPKGAEDDGVIP